MANSENDKYFSEVTAGVAAYFGVRVEDLLAGPRRPPNCLTALDYAVYFLRGRAGRNPSQLGWYEISTRLGLASDQEAHRSWDRVERNPLSAKHLPGIAMAIIRTMPSLPEMP